MSDPLADLSTALGDRYRIERELGAGGMATVYLAEDLKHNRKVAVKVLKPELAIAIGAARFLAEIKTTANLQHPHILALHDSGEVNGTVFYVMPYVEGESLRDRLEREKQLPVDDALRIAAEVADALEYAHERGVIHRDIKPENILLQRGHAVVADFGIALAASKTGGARMTETGMSLGTPTYMSPEQAMGAREVDARTDVYSLGCVLYEMLVGEPPFVGPTAQSIVAKVMTESPRSLTGQRRTVAPHVDAAVQKSLEKLAADRFASAAAFAEALRDGGQSLRATVHETAHAPARRRSLAGRMARWAAMLVAGVAIASAAFVAGRRSGDYRASTGLSMEQRTFRTQAIFSARYAADGESIVYSAAEVGDSPRIYTVTSAYPQPRAVSDSGIHLLAVSSKDEMAVLVGAVYEHHRVLTGTLARMPVGGGMPRELLTDVHDADWSPDGSQLAVAHDVDGKDVLEYPIGTVLYESPRYLSDVRVAPDGQHVAFNEHPEKGDDRGAVAVVDLKGGHKLLTPQYPAIEGLAWTPG
ncbi:MAG TPA: serine/threonine-protein kinase, partial [Gemmatimonadaceae bacterium]